MARRKRTKLPFDPTKLPFDPRKPRAECFLLCDYARAENGKLYIVGGGWNEIAPQQLPLDYSAYLASKVSIPWDLVGEGVVIRIDLLNLSGQLLGDPVFENEVRPEQLASIIPEGTSEKPGVFVAEFFIAVGIEMKIARAGRYFLRLLVNDETVAATSFVVVAPAGGETIGEEEND